MSYIDGQIRELREIAEMYEGMDGGELLKECADTIESLYKKLNEKSNGGWISCSERLPKNKDNVLVCWGGKNVSVGYFVSGGLGGWFFEQLAGGYKIPYEPYAWKPLPEAYHG